MPDVLETSDAVLQHLQPIDEVRGFTSEIFLNEVDHQHLRPVRNLLTAGSSLRVVTRDKHDSSRFFVHADLYSTLARIRARELAIEGRMRRPVIEGGPLRQAAVASVERRQLPDLNRAARAPVHDRAHEEDLKLEIWNELLGVMGLDLTAASRIRHPGVREQATAAWYALDQLAHTNDRLRIFLKDAEDYKVEAVAERYSEIRSRLAADPNDIALLDEVDADLQSILKPLLLLPESGLLQELIERLEDPAQHDDGQGPGEQDLRDLLTAIRNEIERIDKSSPEAWRRVAHIIQMRKAPTQSLSELDPINKRAI
jgi:hypothetical protein